MKRVLQIPFIFGFLFIALGLPAASFAEVNSLEKVNNRPVSETQSVLNFELAQKPDYEILTNYPAKVMIIKFRNTLPGQIPKLIALNDPLISGIEIQEMEFANRITGQKTLEYWAKIKLKHTHMSHRILPNPKKPNQLTVELTRHIVKEKKSGAVELVEMFRELNPNSERLLITLDREAEYDIIRDETQPGSIMRVRIQGAKMTPDLIIPGAPTQMIKKIEVEERGRFLQITIVPDTYVINIDRKEIQKPEFQIQLNMVPDKTQTVAAQAKIIETEQAAKDQISREERDRQQFITKKFEEAEYEFRRADYEKAALMFKNIYNFSPLSEVGLRAMFRSADAFAHSEKRKKEKGNVNFVIRQYQEAINAALLADTGYEDVPRAYYGIGITYLSKDLYLDALSQFNLLMELYPESPFARDAEFESGKIHLKLLRYQKAIDVLKKYIQDNASAPQVPIAHYKIGEAQFQMGQFKAAKKSFDKAWSMNPQYMAQDPELMFRMGEAYYENGDYATARQLYETLLDKYPNERFSNLVAIRIGDYFRSEEKIEDAIKAYEKAVVQYTKELLLVGKMRIANIYADNPEEGAYKKALEIYNFVIDRHPFSDQVEEARLRRGLTLSLFHHYKEAVEDLETFCANYPENIYVKNNIIIDRIHETIYNYIKDEYDKKNYMGALGVFESFKNQYYARPHLSKCYHTDRPIQFGQDRPNQMGKAPLFLLADSSFRLGLNDQAITLFDEITKDPQDALTPLALFSKGQIYDFQENFDKAQQVYADFIAKYPNHTYTSPAKKALGDSYYKVQQFDRVERAVRIYTQTVRDYQDADNPLDREIISPSWFALGNLYEENGQYDEAIRSYKRVLSTYEHPLEDAKVLPIVVDTHFILGNLYYELNQMPEAMAAYNEAIRLFPKSDKAPWAKYQKGQIYIKYNEKAKALKIFEELMEQAKKEPDALWGPLAVESHRLLVNDLNFEKYLGREAKGTLQ